MNNKEQVIANYKTVLNLAKEIGCTTKSISQLHYYLEVKLNILGVTFQDDGFDTIKNYTISTRNEIDKATADVEIVMNRLIIYGDSIYESLKQL